MRKNWNLLTACDWSSLSYLPCQCTGSLSPTVKQQMQQKQQYLDYSFYTSSDWLKFAYVTNPVPPETRCMTYKLHSQRHMLPFFSILLALHTQDTFTLVLNFEVGHFTCLFLLLSFFLLVLLWKEFLPHSFMVTFHFSCSPGSPPVLFSFGQGRLLDSRKCQLFCLHIQHATHCLFEWQTLVCSLEAVVYGFCLSILLPKLNCILNSLFL